MRYDVTDLRALLLAAHPEWKGKIWIYPDCVVVRGLGSVWPRYQEIPVKDQASYLLDYFDDMIQSMHTSG